MVRLGFISFITESGGGQDTDGNTVPATKVISDPIECNLMTVKKEYRTLVHGQWLDAKYQIYVDNDKIPSTLDLLQVKEIRLKNPKNQDLGTFQIHNIEFLQLSQQVKIVVGDGT